MIIEKYQVLNRAGESVGWHDTYQAAVDEAGTEFAVEELRFEFSDSSLVYTPDGAGTWPPGRRNQNQEETNEND